MGSILRDPDWNIAHMSVWENKILQVFVCGPRWREVAGLKSPFSQLFLEDLEATVDQIVNAPVYSFTRIVFSNFYTMLR